MKERFKIAVKQNEVTFYAEVEGEEVFQHRGFRYFLHRHYEDEPQWYVSCARSGVAVGKGAFPEDAIRWARKNLHFKYSRYILMLKIRERAKWKRPLE